MFEDWRKHVIGIALRLPAVLANEMIYIGTLSVKELTEFTSVHVHDNLDNKALYLLAWFLLLSPVQFLVAFYSHLICLTCVAASHYFFHVFSRSCAFFTFESATSAATAETLSFVAKSKDILLGNSTCVLDFVQRYSSGTWLGSVVSVFLLQLLLALVPATLRRSKSVNVLFFAWPLPHWLCVHQNHYLESLINLSFSFSVVFLAYLSAIKLFKSDSHLKLAWLKMKLIVGFFGWPGVLTWATAAAAGVEPGGALA